MIKTPFTYFLAILSVFASCGGSHDSTVTSEVTMNVDNVAAAPVDTRSEENMQPESRHEVDKGSEPYKLGREHAARFSRECRTESDIRDGLLDINARIYNIRCRIGQDAADDYAQGFKAYLTEQGDTLANLPF